MKVKAVFQKFIVVALSMILVVSSPASTYAKLSAEMLDMFAQNDVMFYDPDETERNLCSSSSSTGDCYIAGSNWDERMWSALRHVGFTPEQTAGVLGNIAHEANTPVRQEISYNMARENGCLTEEGLAYDIEIDFTTVEGGLHHDSCMQNYSDAYKKGSNVQGVGIGLAGWTWPTIRQAYLKILTDLGLEKYFKGEAWRTYGSYATDDELREAIKNETGSEDDYYALWCAAIGFMWSELKDKEFMNQTTVAEYAGWDAANYERCAGGCEVGGDQYNLRIATAEEYYEKYEDGYFDAVENGSLPSEIESVGGDGSNVTIIGDSITKDSMVAIKKKLPEADIIAQDSKQFAGTDDSNPTGVQVLDDLIADNKLRSRVVFALGSSGATVSSSDIATVVEKVGPSKEIFFLTNLDISDTKKYEDNNDEFNGAAATYNNVKIIDWMGAVLSASGSPEDYIVDESESAGHALRPTDSGQELLARLIADAIGKSETKVDSACNESYTNGELVFYNQNADPWGTMPFYTDDCRASGPNPTPSDWGSLAPQDWGTIGAGGCGPSALAMIITALTGRKITPDITAKKVVEIGASACYGGSYYGTVANPAKDYGLTVENHAVSAITVEEISNYLRQGDMFDILVAKEGYFGDGHFIGLRGITDEGKWLIFDSNWWDNMNKRTIPKDEVAPTNYKEWEPEFIMSCIKGGTISRISKGN